MYGAILLRQSRALERMQLYATKPLVRSVVAVIWAIFTLGVLAAVVFRYLLGRRIGHGAMMAFGFSFYCTLPFAVYGLQLFDGGPGNEFWVREFEAAYKKSPIMLFWFLVGVLAFYCGTGWRAAEVLAYANVIGVKDATLYDGGWYEWSADPKNPVDSGLPPEMKNGK